MHAYISMLVVNTSKGFTHDMIYSHAHVVNNGKISINIKGMLFSNIFFKFLIIFLNPLFAITFFCKGLLIIKAHAL